MQEQNTIKPEAALQHLAQLVSNIRLSAEEHRVAGVCIQLLRQKIQEAAPAPAPVAKKEKK